MTAVWQNPERLKYCEGFEISEGEYTCKCGGCPTGRWIHFNHHAKVLDTVTGKLHEVTPGHEDRKYIYRTFAKDELYNPYEDGPLEDPLDCTPQLTLKAQYDLLTENGYSVELWAVHSDDEHPAIQDEMAHASCWEEYLLNESKGAKGWKSWRYEWRLATPQSDRN